MGSSKKRFRDIEFINKTFAEARIKNRFADIYDEMSDSDIKEIVIQIRNNTVLTQDDYIAFFEGIINSSKGYTEEDKKLVQSYDASKRLNTYLAYQKYCTDMKDKGEDVDVEAWKNSVKVDYLKVRESFILS